MNKIESVFVTLMAVVLIDGLLWITIVGSTPIVDLYIPSLITGIVGSVMLGVAPLIFEIDDWGNALPFICVGLIAHAIFAHASATEPGYRYLYGEIIMIAITCAAWVAIIPYRIKTWNED